MKTRRILLLALSVILFGVVGMRCRGQDANERPGLDAQAAVDHANAELDTAYQDLLAKAADAQEKSSLRDAQRFWIKWRDAEAAYLARHRGAVGGSAMREAYAAAELELIKARIAALEAYASQPPPE